MSLECGSGGKPIGDELDGSGAAQLAAVAESGLVCIEGRGIDPDVSTEFHGEIAVSALNPQATIGFQLGALP